MEGAWGNWVDLALLAYLLFYLHDGYRRGGIVVVLELGGLLAALIGALLLHGWAGELLTAKFGLARPFARAGGFLLVWTVIELVFPLIAGLVYRRVPEKVRASKRVRWAGLVPAGVQGTLMAALLLSLVVSLPFPPAVKADVFESRYASAIVERSNSLQARFDAVFGGAIRETMSFLTIRQGSTETVDLRFTTENFTPAPEAERRMLDLLNAERTARGLRPLEVDATIVPVARLHSADMFRRGYFSHVTPEGLTPADRADAGGVRYFSYGENLAYAPDVSLAHEGLMNSEGHRANILSPEWTRIGIGVQDAGVFGMMFTQNFAD